MELVFERHGLGLLVAPEEEVPEPVFGYRGDLPVFDCYCAASLARPVHRRRVSGALDVEGGVARQTSRVLVVVLFAAPFARGGDVVLNLWAVTKLALDVGVPVHVPLAGPAPH